MPTKVQPSKIKRSIARPKNTPANSLSRNQRQLYRAVALADANPVLLKSGASLDISEIIQANREDEDKEILDS